MMAALMLEKEVVSFPFGGSGRPVEETNCYFLVSSLETMLPEVFLFVSSWY